MPPIIGVGDAAHGCNDGGSAKPSPALLAVGSLVGEDDKKAPTTASIREVEAISRHVQQAAAVWASFIAMRSAPRPWL